MVRELERELGSGRGAIARTAKHLGLNAETVRVWVRNDEQGRWPSGVMASGSESDKDVRIRELEQRLRETERADEILRAAAAFRPGDQPPAAAITRFVDASRADFGVEPICEVIEFPVSTYYAEKKREKSLSRRAMRDEELLPLIRAAWEEAGKRMYGARKV
jgi:transposase-like protein